VLLPPDIGVEVKIRIAPIMDIFGHYMFFDREKLSENIAIF
jgi:hypothetical protein